MRIQDAFKTETFSLPSYEGSEIAIKTKIPVGDILEAQKLSELEMAIYLSSKLIIKWSLEDELSQDSIAQLPIEDLQFLLNKISPIIQKKTLSEKTK